MLHLFTMNTIYLNLLKSDQNANGEEHGDPRSVKEKTVPMPASSPAAVGGGLTKKKKKKALVYS